MRRFRIVIPFILLAILSLLSCEAPSDSRSKKLPIDKSIYKRQRSTGTITDTTLVEISGLAASVKNPGYFWTHNDSGGKTEVYLIDLSGKIQLTVSLEIKRNRDWEDLVLANGKLYIGDFGDNAGKKKRIIIHQITEPKFDAHSVLYVPKDSIKTMMLSYKNGPRDAETLLYDYSMDELVIVTKRDPDAFIYSFPFQKGRRDSIPPIGSVALNYFTAGDSRPNGEFVLKNYDDILYWKSGEGSIAVRIMHQSPVRIPYKKEPQGEAIAFDGRGNLITASEKVIGEKQYLFQFDRK